MFVKVCYWNEAYDGYSGRDYAYTTSLPLKVGDKVIAPTAKNAEQRAMVTAVDLPKPPFACKEITRYYVPEPVEDEAWER